MGETANWEFAAVVAAIAMGLGGLLLFSLVALVGTLRTLLNREQFEPSLARPTRGDAAQFPPPDVMLVESATRLLELTQRADALLAQQARLIDAIRNLVEAGVLRVEASADQNERLMESLRNVQAALSRIDPSYREGQGS